MWPRRRKGREPEESQVSALSEPATASSDLPVPIYLNQRIVFDLLATLEDGFAQLTTVRTSTAATDVQGIEAGASLGTANVFALLGVTLGGAVRKTSDRLHATEMSAQKVHTPTSLFAKLRAILKERDLLRDLTDERGRDDLGSGEFVEFRAVLRKNPLVDTMEGFKELMNLFLPFVDSSTGSPQSQKKPAGKALDPNRLVLSQMDVIVKALTGSGSIDLVAEVAGNDKLRAVVTTDPSYFNDASMSEIIDGEFRVLGKVTRVISEGSEETINLLRKTSFGRFQRQIIDQLTKHFSGATDVGLNFPQMDTEIAGPAIQVIPIAIFS
jgi:hypothetical protein